MFSPERLALLKTYVDAHVPTAERIVEMRAAPRPSEKELFDEMLKLVAEIEIRAVVELGEENRHLSQFHIDLIFFYRHFRRYRETLAELLSARGITMTVDEKFMRAWFTYAALEERGAETTAAGEKETQFF